MTDSLPASPDPREPGDVILGLHHVRIPVTDPWVSRDWYMAALGLAPVLDEEEENEVVGVVLRHPGGLVIGLHRDPARATSLRGFSVVGLTVGGQRELRRLSVLLAERGISHSPPAKGHNGWYLEVRDPDGMLIRFHTGTAPDPEDA